MNVNLDNFEHLVDYLSDYLSSELDHDVRVIYSIVHCVDSTEFIANCYDLDVHAKTTVRNCDLLRMDISAAYSLLSDNLYRLLTNVIKGHQSCSRPWLNGLEEKKEEPIKDEPVTESFTTYSCKLCGSPLIKKGDQFVCPSCGRIYYPNKKECL